MKKILLIGENCKDKTIYGRCDRLCPEAPVPVFIPTKEEETEGMAGNVYRNIMALSPQTKVDFFSNPTEITKTRYVDEVSGQLLLRIDENDKCDLISDIKLSFIGQKIKDYSIIVISSYNKGFLDEKTIQRVAESAYLNNIPVTLDTKLILGEWSKRVTFVKINNKEFKDNQSYLGDPSRYCQNLIVTKGSEGADLYFTEEGKQLLMSFPTDKVEVMNCSGAGDTFHSSLAVKYLESNDINQAITFANRAAAIAVSKRGIVAVSRDDIFEQWIKT